MAATRVLIGDAIACVLAASLEGCTALELAQRGERGKGALGPSEDGRGS